MNITEKNNIGDIVANDYRTATVFKNHSIDFCCNGNRSIDEACKSENIDSQQLVNELNEVLNDTSEKAVDFNHWALDLLADYIEKTHHRYCELKINEIKPYLEKITNVHGEQHPELIEINELFKETAGKMSVHMKKEELILFPFIRKMTKLKSTGETLIAPKFGSVVSPIDIMMDDHTEEGERFQRIRTLSQNYTVPEDGCATYKVTFAMLNEFEDDLHQHIHLENNILFPKSIALEKEFA